MQFKQTILRQLRTIINRTFGTQVFLLVFFFFLLLFDTLQTVFPFARPSSKTLSFPSRPINVFAWQPRADDRRANTSSYWIIVAVAPEVALKASRYYPLSNPLSSPNLPRFFIFLISDGNTGNGGNRFRRSLRATTRKENPVDRMENEVCSSCFCIRHALLVYRWTWLHSGSTGSKTIPRRLVRFLYLA